jgi:hypothetical protein
MTNVNAPFGFRYIGTIDGQGSNFGVLSLQISSANTNSIFTGDALKPISAGFVDVQTATTAGESVAGVALGFEWLSKTTGSKVFRPAWLGNTTDVAGGNVTVKVAMHPFSVFEAQCKTGPLTFTAIGLNLNFAAATSGNTLSGISGMTIDDTTTSTGNVFPFKVWEVPGTSPNPAIPPFDPSNGFNVVKVIFNTAGLNPALP